MNLRLKNIYATLEKKELDGLLVSSSPNISYLTEYTSRDSYILVSKKGNIYFTDSRYIEEAKIGLKDIALIEKINGSVFKLVADVSKNLKIKRLGFEERNLIYGEYKKIRKELDKSIDLIPTHNLIENSRQIKTKDEIEKIKRATQISIKALKFIKNFILPGKKEIEIAAELERFIRYNGGRSSSFEIIVASGPNSSFPHHLTGSRKIKKNEPVLIDLGTDYMGYKSDLTRVFFSGKISFCVRSIYNIILKAQEKAIKLIRPGVYINKIDAVSRQYISKKRYGDFFVHGLGHGIGLEVHELPSISSQEKSQLKTGMVFTVEPAIYLPHKFGIRLEDMVIVTKKGCEVLSGTLHK